MKKVCQICNKKYTTDQRVQKFCSRLCCSKWRKGKNMSPETQFKKGHRPWHAGKPLPDYYKESLSLSKKMKPVKYWLNKKRESMRGVNNWQWRPDTQRKERHEKMGRVEYFFWRRSVYARDNFTCVFCGLRGNRLNAHHILPWKDFAKYRYSRKNGLTLCVECHKKLHSRANNYDINKMPKETRDYVKKIMKLYKKPSTIDIPSKLSDGTRGEI